jgi:sugar phosphate isomerase/epimerase
MSQTALPKNSDAKASRTGGGSSPEQGVRVDRRRFLAAAAAAVGASAVEGMPAVAHGNALSADAPRSLPRERISIQLFTLRDLLASDLQGTLNALRAIGYRRVEHAGFMDRTVQQFKAALDAAGLVASSGHVAIPQPFDAATWNASLQDALTLGSRYIVNPIVGIDFFPAGRVVRDSATWSAVARDLNRAGRMASERGLRFGYHGHNWEFLRLSDQPTKTAFDLLIEQTDPRYVHFELDLFLLWRGAQDPVDLLGRLAGRVRQYHVKDMDLGLPVPPFPTVTAFDMADPGRGLIDFVRIFRTREAEEYIVERDDAGTPPRTKEQALDTARVGFNYLATVQV